MITSRQRLLWAGLLASAAFAASAQTPPPPAAAGGPAAQQQTQRMDRRDPAKRMEQMQKRHAERLAALKQKLQLNASQESAWSTFAAAQQPPAPPAQRMSRDDIAKLTTPQRLDFMQQRQAERSAMFAKRADATRSFYAGLSPEQQKTFDTESLRFGPGGHHGHHGGPGGPDGHRPPPPAKG